jgi:DNA-binding response OmpR family regulator
MEIPSLMEKRVLVVDDEPVIRDLLTRILSEHRFSVDMASSGAEGMLKIAGSEYDAYLLDMKMPGLDGKDMYQMIRENYPSMASRVIFITGDTISSSMPDFLKSTGREYFGKPLDFAALISAIDKLTCSDTGSEVPG